MREFKKLFKKKIFINYLHLEFPLLKPHDCNQNLEKGNLKKSNVAGIVFFIKSVKKTQNRKYSVFIKFQLIK